MKTVALAVCVGLLVAVASGCSSSSGGSPDVVVIADDAGPKHVDCAASAACALCGWCVETYVGHCFAGSVAKCQASADCKVNGCCEYSDVGLSCYHPNGGQCDPACKDQWK